MAVPNIDKFQQAMKFEMQRNKYKEDILSDYLEDGLWRNLRAYLKGEEKEKSLVDLANYCAILWNHLGGF